MSTDAVSPQSPSDVDTLEARLAALEAENARLRAQTQTEVAGASGAPRRGGLWRGILSAVVIVIASILVPVTIVAAWARTELVDESSFVATFGPLASDPHVQDAVIDGVTTAIDEKVDLKGITDDLFDGLQNLGLPPRASSAVDLLRQPAADGLQNLVETAVTRLVQSDAFASTWEAALRASHKALVAAAAGGTAGGGVTISDQGEVGINLGPIIDQVKQRLLDQGIGFASLIPSIDKTIVIAQSDALVTLGVVYNLAVTVGWWLPFITLVIFAIGILIARNRNVAILGSGLGIGIGGASLAAGIGIGGTVLGLSAAQLGVSSSMLGAVYNQVVADMERTAAIVAVLGFLVAVIAWATGRSRPATTVRTGLASVNSGLRRALRGRGVDTGGFGEWMYAQRVVVRAVLVILAVLWLLALKPLSFGDILLVLIVALLVWWLAELAQRRSDEAVAIAPDAEALIAADAVVVAESEADAAAVPVAASAPTPVKPRAPRKPKTPPAES